MTWIKTVLIISFLLTLPFLSVYADPATNAVTNIAPSIQSFSVYTDIGLVFDVTVFDRNEGADISHVRIDVHETDSLLSPIICWFETPTNLTLTTGGTNLEYAFVFKRLTPEQATPIETGSHIYQVNATDDDSEWATSTSLHYMKGEPHYTNLDPRASYIHRSDNNPAPEQVVQFTVYVIDFNTPKTYINVTFYWSIDGKVIWNNKLMIYDDILENWNTNLGPYPQRTEVYYYVIAIDDSQSNRTPATYDFLVWDVSIVTEDHFITLYRGWNLISINIDTDSTAKDIVENEKVISMVKREPTTIIWETVIETTDNDFDLNYEWGYYAYATDTVMVKIEGDIVIGWYLILQPEWNLYGVSEVRESAFIFRTSTINTIVTRNYYGIYETVREGWDKEMILKVDPGYFLFSDSEVEETWYP